MQATARLRLAAWLSLVTFGVTLSQSGCSDDKAGAPGGPRAGSSSSAAGGEEGEGGATSGGGGDGAGAPAAGQGGAAGSGAGEGGAAGGAGGEQAHGGAEAGEAGQATGGGGEGGAPPDPYLIITDGGPWPDSFTGTCALPTGLSACPAKDAPFFGQDGTYRINQPRYTASSTVLNDAITGLSWQLRPTLTEGSQSEAAAYCDALVLGGQDDWRLPTRLEYVTLMDYGWPDGFASPPAIPTDTTGIKWSSSKTGRSLDGFFILDDELGFFNVAPAAGTPAGARCVRGAPLSGSLTVGAGTTVDSMTGLEWQTSELDDTLRTWEEALAYCEQLEHAEQSDWRLPSLKELVTLVDEAAVTAPVVDPVSFGTSSAQSYWSSTPARSFSSEQVAFTLDTLFGSTPSLKMTDAASARCVRTAD